MEEFTSIQMETYKSSKGRLWQRRGFWLCLWSALVASGVVFWQAQDNEYWMQNLDGSTSLKHISVGWLFTFVWVWLASWMLMRVWLNLPKNPRKRFWLVMLAIGLGIVTHSYLCYSVTTSADWLSPTMAPVWIFVWAFLILTGFLFVASFWRFYRWIAQWRNFRRVAYVAAALVLLLAGLRLEEDWRGKRAWQNYRREWEAKGEKFDFAAFIPPPVPAEQNFAMAPMVEQSLAWCWNIRPDREFMVAKVNTDRLAMTLQRTNSFVYTNANIGKWAMAQLTNLKGWQEYYRMRFVTNDCLSQPPEMPGMAITTNTSAESLSREIIPLNMGEFPVCDREQTPAADVLLALSRYDEPLQELTAAARRPLSRFPIRYSLDDPYDVALAHLESLKRCAQVLQLRAIAELEAGKNESALNDLKLMLRLADSVRAEPFQVSQFGRVSSIGMTIQPIWEGLAAQRWKKSELMELNGILSRLDLLADWKSSLAAERAIDIATIEHERSHRTEMSCWLLMACCPQLLMALDKWDFFIPRVPEVFGKFLGAILEPLPWEKLGRLLMNLPPDGWYELNKVEISKFFQQQMSPIADPEKHILSREKYLRISSLLDSKRYNGNYGPKDVFVYQLSHGHLYGLQRLAAAQNAVDMANVACALELYRLAHGDYPPQLDALPPQYTLVVPPDVVSGEPLHYHPTDDGRFLLYSAGWNGKEDGGIVGTNQFGRLDPKNGDWVWKYPSK